MKTLRLTDDEAWEIRFALRDRMIEKETDAALFFDQPRYAPEFAAALKGMRACHELSQRLSSPPRRRR